MNPHLQTAYTHGVQTALAAYGYKNAAELQGAAERLGLIKSAGPLQLLEQPGLLAGLKDIGGLAAKGALPGAAAGFLASDKGEGVSGAARGALGGAAFGTAAGLGGRALGARSAVPPAEQAEWTRIMDAAAPGHGMPSPVNRAASGQALMGTAGALLGGGLAGSTAHHDPSIVDRIRAALGQ